ncbi:MAG: hypothetical protein [Caudoviricetes sp.]|nr:MAG: hypothetical protein [Caudoviricetes sp.]
MKNPETFIDINDQAVQAYNRAKTSLSILEEDGEGAVREYFQQFNEQDRASIAAMMIAHARDPEGTLKRVQERARETSN